MPKTVQIRLQGLGVRQTRIVEGISQYMGLVGDWTVPYQPWRQASRIRSLPEVPCDGAIVDLLSAAEKAPGAVPFPVVVLSGRDAACPYPRALLDNHRAGQAVARALLETGLREFAYVGLPGLWFSDERRRGFSEAIEQAGRPCRVFDPVELLGLPDGWDRVQEALRQFVGELPRPVGVMAANDERAAYLLDLAGQMGLRVPDDLALAGVDNETLICMFGQTPLSSLDDNAVRIGYEAAALLASLMEGEPVPAGDVLVPPGPFVARRSTDLVAAEDPAIAAAIRYIRDHACDGIGVEAVIEHVGLSRSSLQRGVRQAIGRTPGAEIRRIQIERACQLLGETDWSIKRIALATGHRDGRHLSQVFRHQLRSTPTQIRLARRRRLGSG